MFYGHFDGEGNLTSIKSCDDPREGLIPHINRLSEGTGMHAKPLGGVFGDMHKSADEHLVLMVNTQQHAKQVYRGNSLDEAMAFADEWNRDMPDERSAVVICPPTRPIASDASELPVTHEGRLATSESENDANVARAPRHAVG